MLWLIVVGIDWQLVLVDYLVGIDVMVWGPVESMLVPTAIRTVRSRIHP